MSSDTHAPPGTAASAPPDDVLADNDPDIELASPATSHDNVRRRPVTDDAPADPEPAKGKGKKDEDASAKADAADKTKTKTEDRMIPVGPLAATAVGAGVLTVGFAAQAGSAVAGPAGALIGGAAAAGVIGVAAMAARGRRRDSNRRKAKSARRARTRAGMGAAHSGSPFSRGRSHAAGGGSGVGLPSLGGKLGKVARPGRSGRGGGGLLAGASAGKIPGGGKLGGGSILGRGRALAGTVRPGRGGGRSMTHGAAMPGLGRSGGRSMGGSRLLGGGRGGSGLLGGARGGPRGLIGKGKALKTGAANTKVGKAAKRGRDAVARGNAGTARTRTGRAAGAAARYGSAPFKALGAGVAGARKGQTAMGAAAAARRRAIKDHRAQSGAGKRSRHPFRGWGSAAAGAGVFASGRLWKLMVRTWKWSPWNEELAEIERQEAEAAEVAEAAAAEPRRPSPRPLNTTPSPTPGSGEPAPRPSTAQPVVTPAKPELIKPPAPAAPTGGNTVSVPTIAQLIALSEEMKRLATHRAAPGARPGLLEVLDDSKGWAIILENISQAAAQETEAWHRFPVHASIPAMYDAVNRTTSNAAAAMAGIPGTIERIERDTIDRLKNPQTNAQMLDHTANGYKPGRG